MSLGKILVVDDAKFMRLVLVEHLNALGFEVVGEAENGEDAFEKYKSLSPDIVTMDIVMPEKDGIVGLELIHEHDANAKVIMVSALEQKELADKALTLGAKGFVKKPFEKEEIARVLRELGYQC